MAVIDAKKLLPSGQPGGAIVEAQKQFLVPASNISYKKDINISQKLLKPVEKRTQEPGGAIVVIKDKVLRISDIIGNTYLIQQSENNRKRKENERQKAEDREKKLETKKPTEVNKNNLAKIAIPGASILDTINRFIGFTLLGYLFDKYSKFLPKLLEFGKYIAPVVKFIESFGKNLVNSVINFIDAGYKAYDFVHKSIEQIGGKDAAKTFDEFSGELNKLLNGAIGAAMLIASTAPRSPKGVAGGIGAGMGVGRRFGYTPEPLTSGVKPGTVEGRGILSQQRQATRSAEKAARRNAGALLRRGGKTLTEEAAGQVATQGAKQSLKSIAAVPIVGALIGFIIDTVVFREKPSRAAAGAVGSALGSALGIALAGGTTFGLGAGVGLFVGGWAGDWLGKTLYDGLTGHKQEPIQGRAQGGQVTSGQSGVAPTRRIKNTSTRKQPKTYTPPKTQPGKDIGGKLKIEGLYGKDEPGKRSALRALKKSSEDIKKMRSLNGIAGSMFGAGIDMALGQKPDRRLASSLGDVFGSVIQSAIDSELNSSFNDISRTIAMANGGIVPSRSIGGGVSIGEKIGRYISTALAISIEGSASKILQNLNQELNLEGGAPGETPTTPTIGDGGEPLTQNQQEAFEKIRKIAEKVGSPNPSVTAAIAMLETGWLANPNSVYFASGKTNPFGQTGKGPKGSVIGKDGQEHAVYNSLEEGVKSHVNRWKSSYIGKTPQEIIENIRTGRGKGAPGQYNTNPGWTQDVMSTSQSGTQPQPSGKPTKGAFASVLPRGNPVLTSGFGFRNTGLPGASTNHQGIDIGVDPNSPVTALQDGEVIDIYQDFGGHGQAVVVKHSDGTVNVYGHVNAKVRKGDKVKKGQMIATVKYWKDSRYPGPGGRTHLHLERRISGNAQDPTGYLNSLVPKPKPQQPQLGKVIRSSNVDGTVYTEREGGKYFQNGKPITKELYDAVKKNHLSSFGAQASIGQSQSKEIASLQQHPSYSQGGLAIIQSNVFAIQPVEVG